MNEQKQLKLVKEGDFLGTRCDFYMDDKQNVYMTRTQIGEALQYANPNDAVRNIHTRNKQRLDSFSVSLKLSGTDGKYYDTTLYVTRGIYDICRFSRQPVADQFYDWVYDQIETLRLTAGVVDAERDTQFEEIKKAKRENRLVILPFAIGDMVKLAGGEDGDEPLRVEAIKIYGDGDINLCFKEKRTMIDLTEGEAGFYIKAN